MRRLGTGRGKARKQLSPAAISRTATRRCWRGTASSARRMRPRRSAPGAAGGALLCLILLGRQREQRREGPGSHELLRRRPGLNTSTQAAAAPVHKPAERPPGTDAPPPRKPKPAGKGSGKAAPGNEDAAAPERHKRGYGAERCDYFSSSPGGSGVVPRVRRHRSRRIHDRRPHPSLHRRERPRSRALRFPRHPSYRESASPQRGIKLSADFGLFT